MSDNQYITAEQAAEQFPGPTELVPLHNHTLFSVLDGIASPEAYFKACAERKWPAFAITEHGVMNSIPDAYFAAKETKVKQIVGCEIYYNDFELKRQEIVQRGIKIKEITDPDLNIRIRRNRHLTVLCKNAVGYENLLKLNRYAYEYGFFYKPRIWFDQLAKHREGLIILSGCLNGPVCHELRTDNFNSRPGFIGAIEYVKKFHSVFGDDYYIELQMPGIPGDVEVFTQLVVIADKMKIKTVITNDCHYLERRDFELQKIMMAIDQGTTVDNPDLFHVNSSEQYLKTRAELRAMFNTHGYSDNVDSSVFEQSCSNTLEVADKCEGFKINLDPKLPKIHDADNELERLALTGLRERDLDKNSTRYMTMDGIEVTYMEQMQIELKRIIEKGFSSYFLITRDLIKCSLDHGLPIGPGRGCTVPDSIIKCSDGNKKIIDINVGDEILDGFGNLKVVENKIIYDVNEDLYVFELYNGLIIEVTSDHKLYIIRNMEVKLLMASEIKDTDEIIGRFDKDQHANQTNY